MHDPQRKPGPARKTARTFATAATLVWLLTGTAGGLASAGTLDLNVSTLPSIPSPSSPTPRLADLSPLLVMLPSPPDADAQLHGALASSSSCEAMTIAQAELCVGPGGVCDYHPSDATKYRCTVYCWEWQDDPTDGGGCSWDAGRDYVHVGIGYYYCPPRGVHESCDQNGSPTNGQFAVQGLYETCDESGSCRIEHWYDTSFAWTLHFTEGVVDPANEQPIYYKSTARGLNVGPPSISGTFGGFFQFDVPKE